MREIEVIVFRALKMPFQFSNEEYADIIFIYGYCNGNSLAAKREYEERFPNRRIPNPKTFASVFQCLRSTGSFPSCSYSVEREEERRIAHEEDVIQQVQRSPRISTRRISNRIGLPQSTVWRILKKENLYPYHFQKVQNLLPGDFALRINFCQWLQENRHKVSSILFTDEATFTRDGINNLRNNHHWSYENPHVTVECSFQHRFSVNVWCGIKEVGGKSRFCA